MWRRQVLSIASAQRGVCAHPAGPTALRAIEKLSGVLESEMQTLLRTGGIRQRQIKASECAFSALKKKGNGRHDLKFS